MQGYAELIEAAVFTAAVCAALAVGALATLAAWLYRRWSTKR